MRIMIMFMMIWGCVLSWAQAAPPLIKKDGPVLVISGETNSSASSKSLATALAASVVLPGLGQKYLLEKRANYPSRWMAVDAIAFAAVMVVQSYKESALNRAYDYAQSYGGLSHQAPKDIDLLERIGQYRSRDGYPDYNVPLESGESYNLDAQRAGQNVDSEFPNTDIYSWNWGPAENPENTKHYHRYHDLLKRYRSSVIWMKVGIGMLLLDRLVAMADVMRLYRNQFTTYAYVTPYEGGSKTSIALELHF